MGAVLPAAFTLAATQDDRLGQVLAPTVERATQASIRKNPGTMVDILYPVMGPAIRKAIAETLDGTLQSLNQALKYSLSWRGLKWRIEAWRSGSTFADVVLRHTAVFRVEHLFLVHRKTGLLLAHVARGRRDHARPAAGVGHALRHPGFRARFLRRIRQRRRPAAAASTACAWATCCCGARKDRRPSSPR